MVYIAGFASNLVADINTLRANDASDKDSRTKLIVSVALRVLAVALVITGVILASIAAFVMPTPGFAVLMAIMGIFTIAVGHNIAVVGDNMSMMIKFKKKTDNEMNEIVRKVLANDPVNDPVTAEEKALYNFPKRVSAAYDEQSHDTIMGAYLFEFPFQIYKAIEGLFNKKSP